MYKPVQLEYWDNYVISFYIVHHVLNVYHVLNIMVEY